MTNPEKLWAVHVEGPDDILAALDRDDAEKHAKAINDWYARWSTRPDANPEFDPRVSAKVIEWDGTPEEHAADVARGDVRWAA